MTVAEAPAAAATGGLDKAYDPAMIEAGLYERWDAAGYFRPTDQLDRDPFVIVMPPPNLTGQLHIGHILMLTVEDVLIRWHRMSGDPTLWLPGADHAGIGGQWAVEKELRDEGLTRHDLGRERFLERTWAFMNRYRGRAREQLRVLGASCDWTRFTFTMDPGPSRAVRIVFKRLYDKGLIYRGRRIISWCPRCMTALSDLEVIHREEDGFLWEIAYPIEGLAGESIAIATTRPETMLGDTGVAVHPDDDRYKHLIGRQVRLPIMDRLIPVVADDAVDPAFGTGAVKVTPSHDPNDFEIGQRHGLPFQTVMNLDGTMNENAGFFAGLPVAEARAKVVERLEQDGVLLRTVPHRHAVGHCERCDTVVQPLVSEQWFVKMQPLAAPAAEVARDGRLTFVPERFAGVYLNWLENIHDWCISRQLWWGHRIPVWYCQDCKEVTVSVEETIPACPACGGAVIQDDDVLDTWFSSGLWPFSTLGWPEQTDDLARFYPGSVMETGYDIIFFWVSRMVFFGLEVMGELPFRTVYLHGLVRDPEGQKLSKTKGNVTDPSELFERYGADAVRFALVFGTTPGDDQKLSTSKIEDSRNFANKLWNATRFALPAMQEAGVDLDAEGPRRPIAPAVDLALADRWIISRLDAVTADSTRLLDAFNLGEAGRQVRNFIWNELCDWYIEAAKVRLKGSDGERRAVAATLAYCLERSVRLLHPFMPFITEVIWQALPHAGDSVMIAAWPSAGIRDERAESEFEALIETVRAIRTARQEANVEPAHWISATIYAGSCATPFESARRELGALARIADDQLRITNEAWSGTTQARTVAAGQVVAELPLAGMVDLPAERARLNKELADAEATRDRANAQLANEAFTARAPVHVVEAQRQRLARADDQIWILRQHLRDLGE